MVYLSKEVVFIYGRLSLLLWREKMEFIVLLLWSEKIGEEMEDDDWEERERHGDESNL